MDKIELEILDFIAANPRARRKAIVAGLPAKYSVPTIGRALRRLVEKGELEVWGQARATEYVVAGTAAVLAHLRTPYNQRPPAEYNPAFPDAYIPGRSYYLTARDRETLHDAGSLIGDPIPAGTYARHIFNKLLIDLSWASSRMEGNTYDIIQTEKLIEIGEQAEGKDQIEAIMILNHKKAIEYMVNNIDSIDINRRTLFDIHALLSQGLLTNPATAGRLRENPVDVSGTSYTPIDIPARIQEEFEIILAKAREITDPFEQSFFLLVHIPYLQGFVDINKRVSRLASNIPLLKADIAPMSFLTMDDKAYIDGVIGVYEINNIGLLRKAYMDGYITSAGNYRILRAEVDKPDKAALKYRGVVYEAVRYSVLEAKAFRKDEVLSIVEKSGVPGEDREDVIRYAHREFNSLHEGNLIRYDLAIDDLKSIDRGA